MNAIDKLNARMGKTIKLRLMLQDALEVIERCTVQEKKGLKGFYKTLEKTYCKIAKIDDAIANQKKKIVSNN